MILVLSPSKSLDFTTPPRIATHTMPDMLADSEILIKKLRSCPPKKLKKLMSISDKLAALNVERYKDFTLPFTPQNSKQAILAFTGDVYDGIGVESYGKADFAFAQKHIRILSGLYGLLRPLDLIQPYRLEMGIRLPNLRGKDLYAFWGSRITQALNQAMAAEKNKLLINLASQEYFAAVQSNVLEGKLLHIIFKENQKGKSTIIGLFAKKARGLMADFIVKNRITNPVDIKEFSQSGYRFAPEPSDPQHWVFERSLK